MHCLNTQHPGFACFATNAPTQVTYALVMATRRASAPSPFDDFRAAKT